MNKKKSQYKHLLHAQLKSKQNSIEFSFSLDFLFSENLDKAPTFVYVHLEKLSILCKECVCAFFFVV